MEKEANKKNAIDLAKLVASQNKMNSQINKNIYGIDDYENIDNVKSVVSGLVNNYNDTIGGSLITKLKEREKDFTIENRQAMDKIKNSIENNRNIAGMQSLLNGLDTQVSKYEDLMIITKIMPQLKDAKKQMVNNILSPDDFTKQLALSLIINNKSLETEKPEIYQEFMSVLEKNEVTKHIKHTIDRTVTLGRYYLAVVPYKKLFNDILKKKRRFNNTVMHESASITEKDIVFINEGVIDDTFENKDIVKTQLKDVYDNTKICEGASNLFDMELVQETTFKNIDFNKLSNQNSKNSTGSEGFMSSKEIQDEQINISGAKTKRLDPRRLIKLAIDDTILGYYYLETQETANIIKNPGAFRLKQNNRIQDTDNGINEMYRSLGELLLKKLDRKMIERNADIKEQLYDVLKYADAANSRLKIIYLDPEDVQEFEIDDGESMFEQSLLYAKMYISELLSTLSARIARSNDVRAYYVNTDAQGGVSPMVMNAINTLKKSSRGFYSMTNLGKMISSFNSFDDLFIPRTEGDNKPIDFDIIQGQQIDINTDLLETLEKICVESSGVPLALIQSASEVDFAKTFAMLNLKFMKTVLDYQIDLNPSVTGYIKKVLLAEFPDDTEKQQIILSLVSRLQSPINLLLNNQLEQINNAKDLSQALGEITLGTNDTDQAVLDMFILEICKLYAPNVKWTEFTQILQKIKITITSQAKADDTEDDV